MAEDRTVSEENVPKTQEEECLAIFYSVPLSFDFFIELCNLDSVMANHP